MPAYHVARSIVIDASADKVLAALKDYRQWPVWSPWLILEPDCPLDFSENQGEVGANYAWNCQMIGEGSMRLTSVSDQRLEMDLVFLRPFKSNATVVFDIEPEGGAQKVTWHMHGSLPFFMFFMTKMMKAWIGMDYDRGLRMLKSYVETGEVKSQLEIVGSSETAEICYVGIENSCPSLDAIAPVMEKDYASLVALFEEKGWEPSQPPFSLYYSMDKVTTGMEFISAFPVAQPVTVEPPFVCRTLPAAKTYVVQHKGEYQFLGNAWGMAMTAVRHHKIKIKKKPVGLERYLNDPRDADTTPEELLTEVVLFRK